MAHWGSSTRLPAPESWCATIAMALSKKYITPLSTSFLTVKQIRTSREDLLYKVISQRQTTVPELYQKVRPSVVKDKESATSASWHHHITLRGLLHCCCCFNYFLNLQYLYGYLPECLSAHLCIPGAFRI